MLPGAIRLCQLLNCMRQRGVAIPMTAGQVEQIGMDGIIDQLLSLRLHELAFKVGRDVRLLEALPASFRRAVCSLVCVGAEPTAGADVCQLEVWLPEQAGHAVDDARATCREMAGTISADIG